jgi:hypothetical protein
MLEVGHNATSLLGKLSCHFLTRGSRSPDRGPAAQRAQPVTRLLPREALRFAYFARPPEVSRHAFHSSCLLQASYQAPFANPGYMALHDRRGVAIWWWNAEGPLAVPKGGPPAGLKVIPEPVCQPLEDGFHHLHLDSGFEARCIRNGMVVGSAWRRSPFDRIAWQDFLEAHGAAPGELAAGPPIAVDPPPVLTARPCGGRPLLKAVHPRERLLALALATTGAAGAWWHGEAAAFAAAQSQVEGETVRLAGIVRNYDLMVSAREDQARIAEARRLAGTGAAALRLIRVLRLVAGHDLKISTIRLDGEQLDLLLAAGADAAKLRALATEIESLPEFSSVVGTPGPDGGQMRLTAKVAT